jgi:hypothetical protein
MSISFDKNSNFMMGCMPPMTENDYLPRKQFYLSVLTEA